MLFLMVAFSGFGVGLAAGMALASFMEYNARKLFIDAILAKNYQELQRGRAIDEMTKKTESIPVPRTDKLMLRTIDGREIPIDEVS